MGRGSDMTISFESLPGVRVTGSKKMVGLDLGSRLVDGLSPTRGHGGVRYANSSITPAVSQIILFGCDG